MGRRTTGTVDLTLDSLAELPSPARSCVYWELDATSASRAARNGAGALEKDIPGLAARYDLSPAQIKSAALTARYAALADRGRAIDIADLETAVQLELTKEGRSPASAEVRPIPRSRMTLRG